MDGSEKIKHYTKGDQTFVITCSDPYGFWTIKQAKQGPAPKEFAGQYTSLHDAQKAIDAFVNTKAAKSARPNQEQKRQAREFPQELTE